MNRTIHRILIIVLSLQFSLAPGLTSAQSTPQVSDQSSSSFDISQVDPMIDVLSKIKDLPLPPTLSSNDPSLDSNPFYLRSQTWERASDNTAKDLTPSFSSGQGFFKLVIPAAHKSLTVRESLRPILLTDEFLFLEATNDFTEFEKKSPGDSGQGLFIISYLDLLNSSGEEKPVPIYFLPLPGNTWKEKVQAFDFSTNNVVVVVDSEGSQIPIPLNDIHETVRAEKFNLQAAQATTLCWKLEDGVKSLSPNELPLPGLTAGFGIYFTGINLEHSERSLADSTSFHSKIFANVFNLVKQLGISEARADEQSNNSFLEPKNKTRLIRIGAVMAVALVAAVGLRMTLLKDFFNKRHQGRLESGEIKGRFAKSKVGAFLKDVGDLFPVNLAFVNQAPPVWFADTVEFFADRSSRILPTAENGLIRRFLNSTILFARSTWERLPVNMWTFVQGALILGGTDTFFVGLQLYTFFPWMSELLAHNVPLEYISARLETAFKGDLSANAVGNELIRNLSAYLTRGAASLSQDVQEQFKTKIDGEVKEAMQREGLDPDATENQAIKKARIDAGLERELKRLGFPSKDEFVYDAMWIRDQVYGILGYKVPSYALSAGRAESEFSGTSRPGLVIPAVKKALDSLLARQKNVGTQDTAEAIGLLSSSLSRMTYSSRFLTGPAKALLNSSGKSVITELREARQEILALTYDGSANIPSELLPPSWRGTSQQGRQLAAKSFKEAFNLLAEGPKKPTDIYVPDKDGFFARIQDRRATRQANERFLAEKGYSLNPGNASKADIEIWIQHYKNAMTRILGVYPDYDGNAVLEQKVKTQSATQATNFLEKESVKKYMVILNDEQRLNFEASVHAKNFVDTYIRATKIEEGLPATSPGQPGRFQRFRQTSIIRNNGALTRTARMFESTIPNDQYKTGLKSAVDRNIPFWYDIRTANIRVMKRFVTTMIPIYWSNRFLYSMDLRASVWSIAVLSNWTIGAPAQYMNRFFAAEGWKQMGSMPMMLLFGGIYTWATCWGEIPQMAFLKDFDGLFTIPRAAAAVGAVVATWAAREKLKDRSERRRYEEVKGKYEETMRCRGQLENLSPQALESTIEQ